MYVIRRWYKTKRGHAMQAATLIHKQAQIFHNAGHRSKFRVSFNGGTLPGEKDVVCLEWTDQALESPYRADNELPREALEIGMKLREAGLVESQWIEFFEMLTPDKFKE